MIFVKLELHPSAPHSVTQTRTQTRTHKRTHTRTERERERETHQFHHISGCSFLYMGHYRISLSSSVVTLPAVSEEDCLLECMSSDTCQIVSYYKGTCQHSSSEQIITSIRSSELGWSQYKKKLCFSKGSRFLAIRTSQSLTTSARPTKRKSFHSYSYLH